MNISILIIYKCLLFSNEAEYFIHDSSYKTDPPQQVKFSDNNLTASVDGLECLIAYFVLG